MSLFSSLLLEHLGQYSDQSLILACSGGVDSIVLLHEVSNLVKRNALSSPVSVCYVNHGLSEQADSWQDFVRQQCLRLSLPFNAKQLKLKNNSQRSLEEQARTARYQVLKELAGENGVVVTGHHLDDQSETFLLALKRGAGLKGLSAMTSDGELFTEKGTLQLCRPFLTLSRAQIVARAQEWGLTWVEDESNQDCQFDRNFIRQKVMPALRLRWPSIATTIARSAQHCQDAQQLIDEIAQQDLAQCTLQTKVLSVSKLLLLSPSRFNYLMRYFLAQHQQLMPSTAQLAQIRQQLNAPQDKAPAVKLGAVWLRRFQDTLHLTPEFADLSHWQQQLKLADLNGSVVDLPDNLGKLQLTPQNKLTANLGDVNAMAFSLPKGVTELRLSFSHQNPKCQPDYRQHSRSLKKIWQELAVPTWQRNRIPLVFSGEQLVMAIGYFVCKEFMVERHLDKFSVSQIDNSEIA
ncbi:tRNA(Ile)-lysidine synthase [Thalassotalea insulae]|uniref:tRNA(Ile)-lysidine synthase n=1 Tax=Thalassotalea insulae TaxID=2056778 RepID=A0ABQ6GR64_9GAMM|nr:tRNA lysidine(34) synthetase TilS [Thalassotalea insulae]GLX77180.1 tRNA(Ile)-lysidine synthase [Thalassotalea insulae]